MCSSDLRGLAQGTDVNKDLEHKLALHVNRRHCTLVSNCTDALYIALVSLKLPHGFRAAVPSLTWVSTASAVCRAGGVPVFYDVDENYTINVEQDFSDVDVIMAVDLLGNSCNWEELEKKCAGKYIINDSAQAFGTIHQGRSSLTRGIISCVSFGPLKPLPSFGSGGALLTDNEELAREHKLLRLHYKRDNLDLETIHPNAIHSINSVMSSFEVSAVTVCLEHYKKWQERRVKIAEYYKSTLGLDSSYNTNQESNALYRFAMRHPKKQFIIDNMFNNGVQVSGLYHPLYMEPRFKHYERKVCTLANKYSFQSFVIPNQHTLTDGEVETVAEKIKELL